MFLLESSGKRTNLRLGAAELQNNDLLNRIRKEHNQCETGSFRGQNKWSECILWYQDHAGTFECVWVKIEGNFGKKIEIDENDEH